MRFNPQCRILVELLDDCLGIDPVRLELLGSTVGAYQCYQVRANQNQGFHLDRGASRMCYGEKVVGRSKRFRFGRALAECIYGSKLLSTFWHSSSRQVPMKSCHNIRVHMKHRSPIQPLSPRVLLTCTAHCIVPSQKLHSVKAITPLSPYN
jgi:hypothetical protein